MLAAVTGGVTVRELDVASGGRFGGVREEQPPASRRHNTSSAATTIPKAAPIQLSFPRIAAFAE
jgi:hypothetical protein